jgi:pSer/pThr/pTyr-binding forkhead associated (FHA) protein
MLYNQERNKTMMLEVAPILIAQTGPLKGQRWSLNKPHLIGREATCDIIVADRMVSRFHARLTPVQGGFQIEDLGSKNGTHCNGNLVSERVQLRDGDVLQIALCQQFIYLSSDATMPLSEVGTTEGRIKMDLRSRRVWVSDILIDPSLSVLQFHVLQILYDHQGQVIPRQQLVSESWGEDEAVGVSDQALDALLRRLRDRIATIDPSRVYIVTIRGHGIKLDNPSLIEK